MVRPLLPLVLVALVALAGCSGLPGSASQGEATPVEPGLTSFTSGGGTCVEHASLNSSVETAVDGPNSHVTVAANVTVPDANYVLEEPTFDRNGPDEYTLWVQSSEEPEKEGRDCIAVARYEATVQVPHESDESFTITVIHERKTAMEIRVSENGSGVGAAASAGGA